MWTRLALFAVMAAGIACTCDAADKPPRQGKPKLQRKTEAPVVVFDKTRELGRCERPQYPKDAVRNEETGKVTVRLTIDDDGRAVDGTVLSSSGFMSLDDATLGAYLSCRFSIQKGRPLQTIDFETVWTLE
jgi:TonB family protein